MGVVTGIRGGEVYRIILNTAYKEQQCQKRQVGSTDIIGPAYGDTDMRGVSLAPYFLTPTSTYATANLAAKAMMFPPV